MSELPPGWIRVDLEDALAPLEDGRTIHQGWSPQCEKEPSENDDVWGVVKTTAIQSGAFLPEHNKRLPDTLTPRPSLEVRRGDVLITCAGPRARCGVACLVRDTRPRLMLSGKMYRFRFDDQFIDPRYVEAYLLSDTAVAAIDRMKTGGSDSGLNLTHGRFRKLHFPLAPRAEQERIVAAIEEQLSRLDAAERSLRYARAKIGPLRDSAISSALRPDWPAAPLGSLVREPLRNGHSAKAAPGGTVRTLTLTAVTVGDFSEANTKLTAADPDRVKHLWLEPGDVFIERSNTPELVGTAALYRGPRNWAIFPDLLIRVRVADALLPEFLNIVLKARRVRRYFQTSAQGIAGSMPKIDQGVVERLDLPVPRLEEQRSVIETVEHQLSLVDALAAAVDAALRRSAALRRAILARAFAGELVPQDPSDEPASALLERIAAQRAAAGSMRRPDPSRRHREVGREP